ncbi:MAG: dipeptidyl aminopeptidase/acylaminoacyl peptidase [Chlamydiales bacterium]|jgi:dipeptidyl aminopeptidase/acylaminoacyl peptidase
MTAMPAALAAAVQEPLTAWDVAMLKDVTSAQISPDGRYVAYTLSVPREPKQDEDGSARSQLHVLDLESGESSAYVTADSGVRSVHWSPNSRDIGFVAKREGDEHSVLYMLPVRGGEARRAASLKGRSISSYTLSPDGAQVALLSKPAETKQRKADKKNGFKAEIYEEDWHAAELSIVTLFDEDSEPIEVPVDGHPSALAWSPNGERLALGVAPTPLVDDSYMLKRIRIVDLASGSGSVTAEIANRGKLGSFRWSPDGAGLAIIAAFDEHDGVAGRLLWSSAAPSIEAHVPTPMLAKRERDEHQVEWLANGRLLVRGSQGGWSTIDTYAVVDGRATDRAALLPLEGPVWRGVSISADGSQAALVGSSSEHSGELYTLDLGTSALVRRTDSNPSLASAVMSRQEVIRYPARDGLAIEGILIHPVEGSPLPAPLIVAVHGGPESHISNGWLTGYSYGGQLAAAKGYAVFYPNYRGSTGRGLGYLKASQGDPAGKEFDDVVDGVDYLIETGLVDAERVGVTGGSYGGYATAWCSTYYSDRFAAGVMFVGISNKISKVGTTDIADEEFYVHAMKRPWDDWQFFLERSPIFHADKSKTPLLIMHGKDDTRVDPGQSREMYRHLKLRGQAPVRLVHYPGEGHGNRKAGARFDYSLRMMRWFDHYLMGEGGEAPDWEIDYDAHLPADPEEDEPGS